MNEFLRIAEALIHEHIKELTANVIAGPTIGENGPPDGMTAFADYRYLCGVIEGLNSTLHHLETARKKVMGEA